MPMCSTTRANIVTEQTFTALFGRWRYINNWPLNYLLSGLDTNSMEEFDWPFLLGNRVDAKKSRNIGAICGLGTDPNTGYPHLPDHDIELSFDVKIDIEDIYKINGVRMAINFAIGSQSSVSGWGEEAVYKIQDTARAKLLELIQKRREPCEIINPPHMYQWNQLDPDDILDHEVNVDETAVLLNLHSAIALIDEEQDVAPTSFSEREKLRQHCQTLRSAIRRPINKFPILCELCNLPCPTQQLLCLHLETQRHKRLESELQS